MPPRSRLGRVARAGAPAALRALAVAGAGASVILAPLTPTDDRNRRAAASEPRASAARSGVTIERGLRYGRSRAMVLDVYRPRPRSARPAVLVVHGGGWRSGDKDRMERVSRAVAEAGFVAVNANYSLAAWWRPGIQGS
jgi:acetyl esterase/lipase